MSNNDIKIYLYHYLCFQSLYVNVNKMHVYDTQESINFGTNVDFNTNNLKFQIAEQIKVIIGVIIDKSLNFHAHADSILKKMPAKYFLLCKLIKYFNFFYFCSIILYNLLAYEIKPVFENKFFHSISH